MNASPHGSLQPSLLICTLPLQQWEPWLSPWPSIYFIVQFRLTHCGCLCYDQWFYSWKFILLRYSPKKIKMHMRGSSLVDWLFAKIWFPFFCGRITLLCHLNSGKTRWLVWVKNVNRLHMSLSGRRFKPLCVLSPSLSFVLHRSANCCCC